MTNGHDNQRNTTTRAPSFSYDNQAITHHGKHRGDLATSLFLGRHIRDRCEPGAHAADLHFRSGDKKRLGRGGSEFQCFVRYRGNSSSDNIYGGDQKGDTEGDQVPTVSVAEARLRGRE